MLKDTRYIKLSDMDRRDFLKIAGLSAAAGSIGIAGCTKKSEDGEGKMTCKTNPGNGDRISALGYGCMRLPVIKDENGNDIVDQEGVNRLFDHAIANGVNYFDTAPIYHKGESEKAVGIALSRYPRDTYFVATKLSNFRDWSIEATMKMYRDSFEYLQTDYIDYYLLHNIGKLEDFNRRFLDNGMIDFLLEERRAGRIRNLGFSFHGQKEGFDQLLELHERYHWDFVLIQLNYMDWTHNSSKNTSAKYLQEELEKKGIPSMVMEPLLGGRLAKVPKHIADRLKERDPQKSAASWAFRFAGTPKGVLAVLSGMTYMEHLQDNIATFSPHKPMTDSEMAFMDETAELMERYPLIGCTDCKYCMPCPYGIEIPGIFLHYNRCVNEGYISGGPESEGYRKARRAYLVSYDRAIGVQSQADRCIGCGKCISKCPQGINIPTEIHRIDQFIDRLRRNKF